MMLPRRCLSSNSTASLIRAQAFRGSARYATAALRPVTAGSLEDRGMAIPQISSRMATPCLSSAAYIGVRHFQTSTLRLAETVKVPQMAESITEGTLKQWNKKKGDFVQADEEVATIETDKVRLKMSC